MLDIFNGFMAEPPRSELVAEETSHSVNEQLFRLVSRQVGSVTLNGANLVALTVLERDEYGNTYSLCKAEDGSLHAFRYAADPDGAVEYLRISDPDMPA
jgi:hypothetical protein